MRTLALGTIITIAAATMAAGCGTSSTPTPGGGSGSTGGSGSSSGSSSSGSASGSTGSSGTSASGTSSSGDSSGSSASGSSSSGSSSTGATSGSTGSSGVSGSGGGSGASASGSSSGASGSGSAGSGSPAGTDAGPPAGNSATGNPDGKGAYTSVVTALFIPASTSPYKINVYLFSKAVTCDMLKAPSWFNVIPSGTQYFELPLSGTSPGTYTIGGLGGNVAGANYSVAPLPTDSLATSGTVTIATFAAMKSITGSFDVKFMGGSAVGTFNATTYCPNAVEP